MTAGLSNTSLPIVQSTKEQRPSDPAHPRKNMKRRRLARLVSHDETWMGEVGATMEKATGEKSPPQTGMVRQIPIPTPLQSEPVLKIHINAVRLEAELFPMRLILSRLMGHPTFNRKGIFNVAVDPVALGLPDYHQIITEPMDLGTVKRKLHAIAYKSREHAAHDIRLTFLNAKKYNPPANLVHVAANELLACFEQAYAELESSVSPIVHPSKDASGPSASTCDTPTQVPVSTQQAGPSDASLMKVCSQGYTTVPPTPVAKPSFGPNAFPHSCPTCKGRECQFCQQGCLLHEPALLVCSGVHCNGAKVRKGSVFYMTADGHRQYCQRCYVSLAPVLPGTTENDACRYKQDLLKRKNTEEIVEEWINCTKCDAGVHSICAMYNGFIHEKSSFECISCRSNDEGMSSPSSVSQDVCDNRYTFLSGSLLPVPMNSLGRQSNGLLADNVLAPCPMASFIQSKVARVLSDTPNADKTVTVRVISDCDKNFQIPDVIRRHFRMATKQGSDVVRPPSLVRYRQKAIALFQRIDGMDVCIYCMYVHEYEGNDVYDEDVDARFVKAAHDKRVYIAYIDSVEHFRPPRARGFETAQIWACPPSRGNCFVFWNHPTSQRTPTRDRLLNWYHGAISRALDCGVVCDVKSLYESEFEKYLADLESQRQEPCSDLTKSGRMICPPLLEGDFWLEEAVRIHDANLSRYIKVRAPTDVCVWHVTPLSSDELDPCPALQIATLVKDRVMTHPSSVPFRRPVNAAAMKLKNYHKIVPNPMDLGTIYSQCVIGEYQELREVVADVELMVANAKRFNPVGHYVHVKADEVLQLFHQELLALVKIWEAGRHDSTNSDDWQAFANMRMSLDFTLELKVPATLVKPSSVIIEDDRSSDGSRSMTFSVESVTSSPLSRCSSSLKDGDEIEQPAAKIRRSPSWQSKSRGKSRRGSRKKTQPQEPPKKLDLLRDGPEAVMHHMVGNDHWLLDRRSSSQAGSKSKACGSKRPRSESSATAEESSSRGRRQAWVGEEVSHAVRQGRTTFFTCSLVPSSSLTDDEKAKRDVFEAYISEYQSFNHIERPVLSPISDARHTLLEFSQYRHFEFDTLRKAKYSTSMLLYHLSNPDTRGVVPVCTSCEINIEEVRWHKVREAVEKRRPTKSILSSTSLEGSFNPEELCSRCHSNHNLKDEFIPIPVSQFGTSF
eukprot:Nitzschia sp. Nitz4//scaffold93_size78505//48358//51951//NITZ4_005424-RA/size78505-processed-gene-0.37-mRNA-1//-1//CDS//3329560300//5432//frame0